MAARASQSSVKSSNAHNPLLTAMTKDEKQTLEEWRGLD